MATKALAAVIPAQILRLAFSVVIQILVARLLLPDGRGVYGICIAVSAFLVVVTYFGNEFGIRYLIASREITTAVAFSYLLSTALLSLTASFALLACASFAGLLETIGATFPQVALACLYSFTQLVSTQVNVALTLSGKYVQASLLAVIEEAAKLSFVMLFLLSGLPTVERALGGSLTGTLLVCSFMVFKYRLYDLQGIRLEWRKFRFIYNFGLRAFWLNMSSLSSGHLGTLVLSPIMSTGAIGVYNLAFGFIARLQVFPDSINRVLVPVSVSRDEMGGRLSAIQMAFTVMVFFGLSLVGVLSFWGHDLFRWLFGEEYGLAGDVSIALAYGYAFKLLGKPIEAHFNEITGSPQKLIGIQIFSVLSMGVLAFFGGQFGGLIGAALGSSLSFFASFAALMYVYQKTSGNSVLVLFRPRLVLAKLVSALISRS